MEVARKRAPTASNLGIIVPILPKPVESTFAAVCLRNKRSRGTTLAMVYQLLQSAQKPITRLQEAMRSRCMLADKIRA